LKRPSLLPRPLSHGLGLVVAGLQSLWLVSRLKPWLKATRGLRSWWRPATAYSTTGSSHKLLVAG